MKAIPRPSSGSRAAAEEEDLLIAHTRCRPRTHRQRSREKPTVRLEAAPCPRDHGAAVGVVEGDAGVSASGGGRLRRAERGLRPWADAAPPKIGHPGRHHHPRQSGSGSRRPGRTLSPHTNTHNNNKQSPEEHHLYARRNLARTPTPLALGRHHRMPSIHVQHSHVPPPAAVTPQRRILHSDQLRLPQARGTVIMDTGPHNTRAPCPAAQQCAAPIRQAANG